MRLKQRMNLFFRGETIPAEEKIHSLFEPHTEWLYKGKSNKRGELGHNILVTSDQWGFIVDHFVVEKKEDGSFFSPHGLFVY